MHVSEVLRFVDDTPKDSAGMPAAPIDVIDVTAISPSKAGTNIQLYIYLDTVTGTSSGGDMVKIGTSSGACAGGDARQASARGGGGTAGQGGGHGVDHTDAQAQEWEIRHWH